jgi:hypothetical protein
MSFKSGSVSDYRAAAALFQGLGWDTVWQLTNGLEFVIRGPGTTGIPVYLGYRIITDDTNKTYALQCFGMSGVNLAVNRLEDHVNVSPGKYLFLDNGQMNYWITYSERRIIATFQISTIFETLYAGLIRAFAPPISDGVSGAYPYPYLIGASAGYVSPTLANWRSSDDTHSLVISPRIIQNLTTPPSTAFLDPSGVWRPCINRAGNDLTVFANACAIAPDFAGLDGNFGMAATSADIPQRIGYRGQLANIGPAFGGSIEVVPCHIIDLASQATYGELDGIVQVPAKIGASALDTVTSDGVEFGVFQNAFRTSFVDYFAQQFS